MPPRRASGRSFGPCPPGSFRSVTLLQVNPLAPEYQLPSCKIAPPPEPKFIRDGYSIADIEGTKPRSRYQFAMRETYEVKDIEGAQAGWRPRHERVRFEGPPRDSLDVKDINDVGFKSTRVTDPLRPVLGRAAIPLEIEREV